jgi:hypothetical protein
MIMSFFSILLIVFSFVWLTPVEAPGSLPPSGRDLAADYHKLESRLSLNPFGMPLYIESHEGADFLEVKVYGILDHSFEKIKHVFQLPGNWCDIVPMHTSIGICTHANTGGADFLTFYGGKSTKRPDNAYQVKYLYNPPVLTPGYFAVSLVANEGPLNTKDHRIELEATSLPHGKTLIRFSCSYSYGRVVQVAMRGYFATIGRSRIGFSISGSDRRGHPVYVGGMKGAIERNAMRSYISILAYMDTLHLSGEHSLDHRLNRWYDLTDRYRKQLFEVERDEYIETKKRGYSRQLQLQSSLSAKADKKI